MKTANEVKQEKELEEIVLTRVIRLNATIQGLVAGLVVGLGLFVSTNWLIIKGGNPVGVHLVLLRQFFLGYEITFVGSLIGFGYGFVTGFLCGYTTAYIYNWFAKAEKTNSQSVQ